MEKHEILDSSEGIKKIDKSGMLDTAASFPDMIRDAFSQFDKMALPKYSALKNIVVSGMGGSAIAGDIVSDLLREGSKVPFYVNRSHKAPYFVGPETLFIALSYSGDTDETLSAAREAIERGARVICAASGGKLGQIAEQNKAPLFLVPTGYQPRAALPYLLVPLMIIAKHLGIINVKDKDDAEAIMLLQKLRKEYGPDNPARTNPVKQLAQKIAGKIPIIFASNGTTGGAGLRLKTQLNENSKTTAIFNLFPELNHNEIVSLAALKKNEHNFSLIFMRSETDYDKIVKRIEITKSLIGTQVGGVSEIWAKGKTPMSRTLSLIYYGDLLSVYMAILEGVDPTPVEIITRLKRELAR